MKRKPYAIPLLATMAGILLLAGCASFPKPSDPNDCLVIIRTRLDKPTTVPAARVYTLELSSGGMTRDLPNATSYKAILIKEPATRVTKIYTRVTTTGYQGGTVSYPLDLALPYRPGYAVIADFVFTQKIVDLGKGSSQSSFSFIKLGDAERATLTKTLEKDGVFEVWQR
jgi:hypothetical protein